MAKKSSKTSSKKPAAAAPAAPAAPVVSPQLSQAKANLDQQVASGAINQSQADAEYSRLSGLAPDELGKLLGNQGNVAAPNYPLPAPFVGTAASTPTLSPGTEFNSNADILNAQAGLNNKYISDQIAANRVSEVGPFGSSMYMQDPSGRQVRVSTIGNLNPEDISAWTGEQYRRQSEQDRGIQSVASDMIPQLRGMMSQPFNYDGITAAPTAEGFQADRQRIEKDLYNRYSAPMEDQFSRQQEGLRQSLADRGIKPGNKIYSQELNDLARQQNEARSNLSSQAVQAGGAEQQRLFENTNQLRSTGIGEKLTQRAQPLSDLKGLMSAVNPVQLPQFSGMSTVQAMPSDITSLVTQDKEFEYNKQLAKLGGGGGGGGGGGVDPFKMAEFNSQLRRQEAQFAADLAKQNQPKQPGSSDFWANLGASFLGSVGSGFASSFGQGLGNSWFGTSK